MSNSGCKEDRSPLFSIVLPTYNREAYIERAIESVLNQSCAAWELIVVDDGSTDATRQVVTAYDDARIRYQFQRNRGNSRARNHGIQLARGLYICFLDSDDQYLEDHLSVLRTHILRRASPVAFFHTLHYKDTNGVRSSRPLRADSRDRIQFWSCPHINSVCVHSRILSSMRFNPQLRIHEDAELWGRIAAQYTVHTIPQYTTVTYRGHASLTVPSLRLYNGLYKTYTVAFSDPHNVYSHVPDAMQKRMMNFFQESAIRYAFREKNYREALRSLLRSPNVLLHLLRRLTPSRAATALIKLARSLARQ